MLDIYATLKLYLSIDFKTRPLIYFSTSQRPRHPSAVFFSPARCLVIYLPFGLDTIAVRGISCEARYEISSGESPGVVATTRRFF